jgi:small-conductance mechanosensitive channel
VGDRVIIDSEHLFVRRFGLLTTSLTKWNGLECVQSNIQLAEKTIYNVRRSGPISEEINLSVDLQAPTFDSLKKYLLDYIERNESRSIEKKVFVYFKAIFDKNRLDIRIILFHRTNWQNTLDRFERRTRFMDKIREGLIAIGIELVDKSSIEFSNSLEM